MDEDFGPSSPETVSLISNRGILVVMAALIIVGSSAAFVFGGRLWGLGVMFGGFLGFVNYLWLDRSTRAAFRHEAVRSAGIMAAKYILRYVIIGVVVLLIFITGALPVAAVILGLAAFAFAVVLQGLKSIFSSSF